jgi:quercetin dioxygenase-like cupin family protein
MRILLASVVAGIVITAPAGAQSPKVLTSPGGTQLRVLVDPASLGGNEVEVGELTFVPNSDSGDHRHAVTETFYVLEGELEQVINGKPVKLGPGMVASIRSTDQVRHKSGPNGAKVLVIWAPGGEIARVTAKWTAK